MTFKSGRLDTLMVLALAATSGASCALPEARSLEGASSSKASDAAVKQPDSSSPAQPMGSSGTGGEGGGSAGREHASGGAPASSDDAGTGFDPKRAVTPPKPSSAPDTPAKPDRCAPIDKLDLLLMIDDSNSMAGEQASLKQALPGMIQALTRGSDLDGTTLFPAPKDLHVGVVSSDMGIRGVEYPPTCKANGGDDGRLQHIPSGANCETQYPQWLSFDNSAPVPPDAGKLGRDVSCIAGLGTGGCGIEQQLEASFKALWPKQYLDLAGREVTPNPYLFLSPDSLQGTWGHGDVPENAGGNLGFLRPGTDPSPSLLVIVAVTDEDDCSVKNTEHLKPASQLPTDSPYYNQDINLRCYYNKQFLYDIQTRYFDGLRKLRAATPDRVMFAAITGIPTELVSDEALDKVDFDAEDPASRQAFYAGILSDSRMQETIDPTMTVPGTGNLTPSCIREVPGETIRATAYPPRRIVELAKLFDKNAIVQSICQDDFAQPTNAIVDMIARKLMHPCGTTSDDQKP